MTESRLENALSQYPVLEALRKYMNKQDLAQLRGVNRQLRHEFASHFMKRGSIDELYKRFFDPEPFREAHSQSRALVSGSTALQFFTGYRWETDLDIYVQAGRWTPSANFLMRSGYIEASERTRYKCMEVFNFLKGNKKVQVMQNYNDPIESIAGFHSTVVMNFMTADFAYCIFPKRTLVRKETQVRSARRLAEIDEWALEKYEGRGWKVLQWLAQRPDKEYGFKTVRTVNDGRTLKVQLYVNVIGGELRGDRKIDMNTLISAFLVKQVVRHSAKQ